MKNDLTKSVTVFNFYRLFGEIEKDYSNRPSMISIDDASTNFSTSNNRARCYLSPRNFETNVSPNNFYRIHRYSNIFLRVNIKASRIFRTFCWSNSRVTEPYKINLHLFFLANKPQIIIPRASYTSSITLIAFLLW